MKPKKKNPKKKKKEESIQKKSNHPIYSLSGNKMRHVKKHGAKYKPKSTNYSKKIKINLR